MIKKSVEDRVDYYKKKRELISSGKYKPMPFVGFPSLTNYVAGIIPGTMYKVTSHSGMGKTQFSKFAFVLQPILYAIKYNINYKVVYFALEESEEEFIDSIFLHVLERKYNVPVNRFTLNGLTSSVLTEDELKAIEMAKADVSLIMSYIHVVDYCYKPTKIYDKCREIAKKLGNFKTDARGNEFYSPNDPNELVLVVCDHISLIEEEMDSETKSYLSHSKSIAKWHTEYARKIITKKWNWACLNIQQQSLESEKQQFTSKGESITSKVLPSLDGVANNREVIRDDYVVFGVFAPDRYEIENFRGYKIRDSSDECFGDNYRSIHVLKNRLGTPNKVLSLFFDGSYTYFEEMPKPTDLGKIKKLYKTINDKQNVRKTRS